MKYTFLDFYGHKKAIRVAKEIRKMGIATKVSKSDIGLFPTYKVHVDSKKRNYPKLIDYYVYET